MPFYRITIWLNDDQVLQGIREHINSNIDYVTNLYRGKAAKEYQNKVIDVEAAMLSKNSNAVKLYLEQKQREQDKKKWNHSSPVVTASRKKTSGSKPTLGDIAGKQS